MIAGSEEESRALMMNAAVRVVAEYGMGGFTTKKWAAEAGVAEGSLYYHFKSKNDLLDQTFLFINREIGAAIGLNTDEKKSIGSVEEVVDVYWRRFYHYLIAHPDRTKYFLRFRTSTNYREEIRDTLAETYSGILDAMRDVTLKNGYRKDIDWVFYWGYVFDATISLAYRVSTGSMSSPENSEEMFLRLLMEGMVTALKKV